jgi:hypothetical protein
MLVSDSFYANDSPKTLSGSYKSFKTLYQAIESSGRIGIGMVRAVCVARTCLGSDNRATHIPDDTQMFLEALETCLARIRIGMDWIEIAAEYGDVYIFF